MGRKFQRKKERYDYFWEECCPLRLELKYNPGQAVRKGGVFAVERKGTRPEDFPFTAGGTVCAPFLSFLKSGPFARIIKSLLMPRPKKTHKIKRSRAKPSKQLEQQSANGETSDEEIRLEKDLPEVFDASSQKFKEETPIKGVVKMDPRNISNLSDEQRSQLRSENPEINEYFLMSAREKGKFFHLLNQKYRQDMKLSQPPGSAPMKKTIRFKKRFEIKPFSYSQKCDEIFHTKSFMELYKAKDESKRRSISKFPRNA